MGKMGSQSGRADGLACPATPQLGDICDAPGRVLTRMLPPNDHDLFLLDRQAVGAEVNPHAFWLLAVLIQLIAHHRHDDYERANNEVEEVAASYRIDLHPGGFPNC
jgi:hypothetical protein